MIAHPELYAVLVVILANIIRLVINVTSFTWDSKKHTHKQKKSALEIKQISYYGKHTFNISINIHSKYHLH